MIKNIWCILWIHLIIDDFFAKRNYIDNSWDKTEKALIRQCKDCGTVINKPYWWYK